MTDLTLALKIKSDLEAAVRDLRRLTGEIKGQGTTARTAAGDTGRLAEATDRQSRSANKAASSTSALEKSYGRLKTAAGAYLSVQAAVALALRADDFVQLQARVERLGGSFRSLYATAQDVNVPVATTVDLFGRLALTRDTLGATTRQVETVAATVLQLGRIGASSQQQIESAAGQLGQAFGSTKAQWEDFGIIADAMPELLRRIEKGLGLLPGTIRQAVSEGVQMKDVFAALLKQAPEIAREFQSIPENLRGSAVNLGNAVDAYLSKLERATGITRTLAEYLSRFTSYLDSRAVTGEQGADAGKTPDERLADVLAAATAARQQLAEAEAQLAKLQDPLFRQTVPDYFTSSLDQRIAEARATVEEVRRQVEILGKAQAEAEARVTEAKGTPPPAPDTTALATNARAVVLAAERAANLPPGSLLALWGVESAYSTNTGLRGPQTKSGQAVGPFQILPTTGTALGIDIDKADFDAQAKAAAEYLSAQLKAFGDLTLAYAAYNAGPGAVAKYGGSVPPYPETQKYVTDAARIREDFLASAGLPDTEALEAAREIEKEIERLAELRADATEKAADTAAAAAEKEQKAVAASTETWLDAIDPVREYKRQIEELTDLYQRGTITLDQYRDGLTLVATRIQDLSKKTGETTDQMTAFAEGAARAIQSAFADALFEPWNQSLDEMLYSFVSALNRMAAEVLATQLLISGLTALGATAGGTGFLSTMLGAVTGGVHHAGGLVGAPAPQRALPAIAWFGAPRLHAGLAADEYPAILQRGEQVLSRAQVASDSGASGSSVRIVNTVDPELARDWVESAAGEKTILNIIRRNPSAVRQSLG